MAYASKRGTRRYTAYYRDALGRRRSAGTFPTKSEALAAAVDAERHPTRMMNQESNDMTYAEHVQYWLKTEDDITVGTKRGYEASMRKYILPKIGHLPLSQISNRVVKALLTELAEQGMSPHMRQQCKAAIGSSFRSLVPEVVPFNPTHGVRVPIPPPQEFDLITPEEFKRIAECMPNQGSRLLAKFLVTSGARFGEATEMRVKDFNFRNNKISITRRVVSPNAAMANGSRFVVLHGTKAGLGRGRHFPLPDALMKEIQQWIADNHLSQDDLVFSRSLVANVTYADDRIVEGETFMKGKREFQHGTPYAYTGGGCRCNRCLAAVREYRRGLRRRQGMNVKPRTNITGHLSNDQWRIIWRNAIEASGIGWYPRTHDLRHACATQMVADGISLKEVMARLGHSQLATTARYQHRVEIEMGKAVESVSTFL